MDADDDQPPASHPIANTRAEFEAKILPAVAEDLRPTTPGMSRVSFYFGALAMLGIVQAGISDSHWHWRTVRYNPEATRRRQVRMDPGVSRGLASKN